MLRKSLIRKCVGGNSCAPARAAGVNFQACAFNHSAISPSIESTTCERLRTDYRTRRAISETLLEDVCIQWFGSDDCQRPKELVSDLLMSCDHLRRFR
jgi:hypothetical protein